MAIAAPGNFFERIITAGIYQYTVTEAKASRLPGQFDGPGDAYRHIILAAELTRVHGEVYARTILNAHEVEGWVSKFIGREASQTQERQNMDNESNERGIAIGKALRETNPGWGDMNAFAEKVVPAARAEITRAYENNSGWWMQNNKWTEPKDKSAYREKQPGVNWPPNKWPTPSSSEQNPDPLALPDYLGKAGYDYIKTIMGLLPSLIPSLVPLRWAFRLAELWQRRDPIILDLDGDGVETTSTRDGTVILFDHDADGVKTGTGWVKRDDGWLVLDRNGNGTIDSGRELYGVDIIKSNGQLATDGFDALKDLDANQDGKITAVDSVFANLRIWRDLNQDGISQANELTTFAAKSITGIGVNASALRTDLDNGNLYTRGYK
jgi:hypothetical protein